MTIKTDYTNYKIKMYVPEEDEEEVILRNPDRLNNKDEDDDISDSDDDLPPWDIFMEDPPEDEMGSADAGKITITVLKFSKFLMAILLYCAVLGGSSISKGTFLFMTSQIRKNIQIEYCDEKNQFLHPKDEKLIAVIPEEERVSWVWILLFTLFVPEVGTFLRSLRVLLFKPTSWLRPRFKDVLTIFTAEILGAIGVSILTFSVLPDLDVLKGAMLTNCVCLVPVIFMLLGELYPENLNSINNNNIALKLKNRKLRITILVSCIIAQLSGFIVWPLVQLESLSLWIIPLAIFLSSFIWWENYVNQSTSLPFVRYLKEVKSRQARARYPTYLIISFFKMFCYYVCMMIIWAARGESVPNLYTMFTTSFTQHVIPLYQVNDSVTFIPSGTQAQFTVEFIQSSPWLLLIHATTAYACFIAAKCACRISLQGFSFASALTVSVPFTLCILIILGAERFKDVCAFKNTIPGYLFFNMPQPDFGEYLKDEFVWVWLFWLTSYLIITIHIWYPKCQRLAPAEQLFVTPMYNALLIDQSIAMNRRIDDEPLHTNYRISVPEFGEKEAKLKRSIPDFEDYLTPQNDDAIPRVIACATMWHETKEEMIEMLKSIIRMDEDQSARRFAREMVIDPSKKNKDYYEFETHIFFDDAFLSANKANVKAEDIGCINGYVQDLLDTINKAASHVHQVDIRLEHPKVMVTPYGGQIIWTLPGSTTLTVHLKDSSKIRHKKRWSQVMYMYYLLGHKLLNLNMSSSRKDVRAQNTYLLALDGDIDFRPEAVLKLIDLMRRDRNLGAACGRIHPIGTGPLVWYQKFEYAVGHWLQKATEHVIGCVLCSPGCFSMFRGSALMDDNVMRRYTTVSEEARHYVQYDQGEDRWLCTLLLQRGYRVEYSAASDSYTHAPEGFFEFFNQRRRWVPSTMANIIDLLGDYKKVVKVNDNISFPYIVYQVILFVGSVLGPGTILLMLIGAFTTVFGWSDLVSLAVNVIPVLIFMLVCYFAKPNTQLTMALVMSFVYIMVMIAVMLGILIQISAEGPLAPSSLFFFIVSSQLIIAALVHPLEISCLLYGVIYYVTIPTMYMLLIIYSVTNLNDVSWGTREDPVKPLTDAQLQLQAAQNTAVANKDTGWFKNLFQRLKSPVYDEEGSVEFSLAGLFKCIWCSYPKSIDIEKQNSALVETLVKIHNKLDKLEEEVEKLQPSKRRLSVRFGRRDSLKLHNIQETNEDSETSEESDSTSSEGSTESTAEVGNYETGSLTNKWISDNPKLQKCPIEMITSNENTFWIQLMEKYLKPLEKNKAKEDKVKAELKSLRDKVVMGFFLLNAMFVFALFIVQLNQDVTALNIPWPIADTTKNNISFTDVPVYEIKIDKEQITLEPIGFVFLVSFALALFVQFIAMLYHRLGTFFHILSTIKIQLYCPGQENNSKMLSQKHLLELSRTLQKLRASSIVSVNEIEKIRQEDSADLIRSNKGFKRRPTLANLENKRRKTIRRPSLAANFHLEMDQLDDMMNGGEYDENMKKLARKLSVRRSTLIALRRSSMAPNNRFSHGSSRHSHASSRSSANSDVRSTVPKRISTVSFQSF